MEVRIKKVDGCERILEIQISQESMQEKLEAVIRRFQKSTSLSGFRQGKAPRELLIKRFEKDIEAEVLKEAIPHSYVLALKETKLLPLGDPEISQVNWRPYSSLSFEVKIEVKPEIRLGNYKGLRLKREISMVVEEEIDNEIKNIQEKMAVFNAVSNRGLKEKDIAVADLEIYVEGKIIPGGKNNNFSLEMGKNFFGPGFDQKLLGLKIGEKEIVQTSLPANYPSAALQNKKASFHFTLKEIREKKLPPIDDELARRIKNCQKLDDLKGEIKRHLKANKENESLREMKNELIEQLIKANDFPLPYSLIERRKERLIEISKYHLKEPGFSEGKNQQEEKQLSEEAKRKAREEIKLALILETIAEKENIIVDREEAKEEFKKMNQYSGEKTSGFSKEEIAGEEISPVFMEQLRHHKTLDFLLSFAKIREKTTPHPKIWFGGKNIKEKKINE